MKRRILHLVKFVWAKANDMYLGIETSYAAAAGSTPDHGGKHNDGRAWQAVDYWNIRRVIHIVAPTQNDVFYDIGCGKGRVICCVARFSLRRIVGIDLNAALCETAQKNAQQLRRRLTPIEVRCQDAAVADVSDGTIYFMFNPFGPETMRDVLAKIERSLRVNPRHVTIVYCNPTLADILDSCTWLLRIHELRNLTGGRIILWRNW